MIIWDFEITINSFSSQICTNNLVSDAANFVEKPLIFHFLCNLLCRGLPLQGLLCLLLCRLFSLLFSPVSSSIPFSSSVFSTFSSIFLCLHLLLSFPHMSSVASYPPSPSLPPSPYSSPSLL